MVTTPTGSGGFRAGLVTETDIVGVDTSFLYVAGGAVWDRGGVTLDADEVAADGNGNKIVEAGTILGKITSSGLHAPFSVAGGANEQVSIDSGAATGGDFTLTFSGETTAAIAFDATAAEVTAALEALAAIDDTDLVVTGTSVDADDVVIEFAGQYANTNVALSATDSTTGGTGLVLTVDQAGSAPTGTAGLETAVGILGASVNLRHGDVVAPMLIAGHVMQARVTGYHADAAADLSGAITFH